MLTYLLDPQICECVCGLFCLVLMSFPEFYTQLALQQIKLLLPESARVQECVLICGWPNFLDLIKPAFLKTGEHTCRPYRLPHPCNVDLEPHFHYRHMAHCLCNPPFTTPHLVSIPLLCRCAGVEECCYLLGRHVAFAVTMCKFERAPSNAPTEQAWLLAK